MFDQPTRARDGKKHPHAVAFFGRPNAGKSSIANRLFGVKLRVGKTPGSTRRIQMIEQDEVIIVDLPGWGLIKNAPTGTIERAKNQILNFFETNTGLVHTLVIVVDLSTYQVVSERLDRKGMLPVEVDAIKTLGKHVQSVLILANKVDKLKPREVDPAVQYLKQSLRSYLNLDLPIIICSAKRDPSSRFQEIKNVILHLTKNK